MAVRHVLFALAALLACTAVLAIAPLKDDKTTALHSKIDARELDSGKLAARPKRFLGVHLHHKKPEKVVVVEAKPPGPHGPHVPHPIEKRFLGVHLHHKKPEKVVVVEAKPPGPHGPHVPHPIEKRFLGIHVHKHPKVYMVQPQPQVYPQVPHQVVYIQKHHRYHHRRPVSVHLHRQHRPRVHVSLGLGH